MWAQLFRKKDIHNIHSSLEHQNTTIEQGKLSKTLRMRDLVAFGVSAVIGAGIFSTIGQASADGGPAIIFLYLFVAIACIFIALAYAEFASLVPISGSAYSYAYVAFGELIAWLIGWALIMEYVISNVTVAISWSDYFTALISRLEIPSLGIHGIHLPEWMCTDYFSAKAAFDESSSKHIVSAAKAWTSAPTIGSFKLIADIPALAINFLITWLVYRGIKESRNTNNIFTIIKLSIICLVIVFGIFHIDSNNWHPFSPNGLSGVLKGISAVFFAYIGFDAISTTAEECQNPQKDIPKSMILSISICTTIYVVTALVLTGVSNYKNLATGDILSNIFVPLGLDFISSIVSVGAIFALAGTLLVFQIGQPRIWMSMSRDGLLPKRFSVIHPKFHTPSFATIITGISVAIPTLFLNLETVTNLCTIGTLFAFAIVCAGILILQSHKKQTNSKFKTPYINAKYIFPLLVIITFSYCYIFNPQVLNGYLDFDGSYKILIPKHFFVISLVTLSILAYLYKLSLIPLLGLICCIYMISLVSFENWLSFAAWLVLGGIIYVLYGYKNSKLRNTIQKTND